MKDLYVTVTGLQHYLGTTPFAIGKKLQCIKEPCNPHDSEAICVMARGCGTVGYVANAWYSRAEGTESAGVVAGKVKKHFTIEVQFVLEKSAICKVVDGRKK